MGNFYALKALNLSTNSEKTLDLYVDVAEMTGSSYYLYGSADRWYPLAVPAAQLGRQTYRRSME